MLKSLYKSGNTFLLVALLSLTYFWGSAQGTLEQTKSIDYYYKEALRYRHQNQLAPAMEALGKAERIAEKKEDLKALLDTHHKFALLYLEMEDRESTLFYWDRAGIILKTLEYPYGEAVQAFIDAAIKFYDGNSFQAMNVLAEAKNLNNDKNLRNNILLLEADILQKIDKLGDASKNYNALLVNSDDQERAYLSTKAHLGLAALHQKQNKPEESIKNGQAALRLARKKSFQREILSAYNLLAAAYKQSGDFERALSFNANINNIKDSIFNIKKMQLEVQTAEKIRVAQQARTIAKLEAENEELSASANRSEITAILTSAFLVIISILSVSLFRNNQIKLRTNDLLQTKNTELEQARDEAISAMEAKSNFLSTVTHELRTPLYAVTGLTHLLLEENPSEHQKEHLKSLKFSGDYLLNFINDILQINKIDADKLEPLNIEFKLRKVLTDVIDTLQQNAKETNTKVVLEYDNNIPLNLLGDPLKISQVFMNLIGNAIKFTQDGQVDVAAKLKSKDEDNVTVYFEVADNGIGISEQQQKNIFDSFEQGSIQINREYGGTGLGLTIVKSLLGIFNTKIGLKSKLGEGSTFYFDLALKVEENAVEEEIEVEMEVEDFDFEGLHILIVEDNKINQVITKKMLAKKDITSDIANNGNEAIDAAKNNTYDCILMDIHMPGISGTEATIQIRKFNPEIPIIALTAISMEDSLEEFYAAGCNAVVTKPFKPEVFYQKIGEYVFKSKVSDDA